MISVKQSIHHNIESGFGALNKDFRYQLTAIGAPGPNLYISEEIFHGVTKYSNSNNNNNNNSSFKIAGGTSGMKVSWQVTGIRQDPWANANQYRLRKISLIRKKATTSTQIFTNNHQRRE
jgi:hypothetical protein